MNNGNLLNSLLGMTGANSAVTKSTAAKARAESSDKFQQALAQARPEVAARKPVAVRKESVAERAAESKVAAPRDSRPEVVKAEAPPKPTRSEQQTEVAQPAKNESRLTNKEVSNSASKTPVSDDNSQVDQDALAADASENQTLVDPAAILLVPQLSDIAVGELGLPSEAAELALDESLITDPNTVAEDVLLNPALLMPATADTTLEPLLVSAQAALGQVGVAQSSGALADDQSLALQVATGKVLGELQSDQALASEDTTAEGELGSDLDATENPDLLLLNSKAALNKSAEASMAAKVLEQPAPSADAAKPAALTAAVESLTRLSDAQAPAGRAFVVQTGVPVTVGSPQWSQAVGDKVLWLAAQNVSSAEIRLDPPELGPLQVKVSVNQDQTSITFSSPHPAVREVLDQQLQRLREMFSDSGLNLVNVDVSDKSFAQQEKEQNESSGAKGSADHDDEDLAPIGVSQALSTRLVDHYA